MKKILKLLFRSGVNINDPFSNLLQIIVFTPIFVILFIILKNYGIRYFAIGVAVLGFLAIIGWLLARK